MTAQSSTFNVTKFALGERHFVTYEFISEYNRSAGSQVGITSVAGILRESGWIWMSYAREGSDLATTQSQLPARFEMTFTA